MWSRRTAMEKAQDVRYLVGTCWGRLLSTCGCWFFWDFGATLPPPPPPASSSPAAPLQPPCLQAGRMPCSHYPLVLLLVVAS